MVISMSQPWRRSDKSAWYFRARVPADLKDKLAGQKLTLRVGGKDRTVVVRDTLKVSLWTRDLAEAKARHAAVHAQVQKRWELARQTVTLTHEQVQQMAGRAYRELVAEFRADPGQPAGWQAYRDQLLEPFRHLDPDSDGVTSEPYDPAQATKELAKLVDLDEVLGISGLRLEEESRANALREVAYARAEAAGTLENMAAGDYSRDRTAERFPDAPRGAPSEPTGGFDALIDGWKKEKAPKEATVALWTGYIEEFIAFIGRDDPRSIRRQDVIDWKAKLLADGASVKTINDSKLAALKAVLGWAVDNGRLDENAAARVSVKRRKRAGNRMLGFDKHDAATILAAAERASSPIYRWVPLLCAASGARVSEICQLRVEDITQVDDVWVMRIRESAGSVKNENAEREVPLHPRVIGAGFLAFVAAKRSGPIFYDPARRRLNSKKPQPKIVAKNVAHWVHTLDVEVGRKEHRKDPNHAWRHLFKTLGRDAGIQDSVLDAITGNGPRSVGQAYGETWLTTAYAAVAKIQLPQLEPEQTPFEPPAAASA